jgi:hypothetical protein
VLHIPLSSEKAEKTSNGASNPALVPRTITVLVRNITKTTEESDVDCEC